MYSGFCGLLLCGLWVFMLIVDFVCFTFCLWPAGQFGCACGCCLVGGGWVGFGC